MAKKEFVHFDGHDFHFDDVRRDPHFLFFACAAREGDARAAELLDTFGYSVSDVQGVSYWPMIPAQQREMSKG